MTCLKPLTAALAAALVAACSPTLDWREFTPEGSELGVSFPCRPDRHARTVALAGSPVELTMYACAAGGATFALGFLDVSDPGRISAALSELLAAARRNLNASSSATEALQMKRMTANEHAVRTVISGHLPDGAPVSEHAEFFTRGLRVYQATVVGAKPEQATVEAFFGALRFPE
jgi:hypothetical protein